MTHRNGYEGRFVHGSSKCHEAVDINKDSRKLKTNGRNILGKRSEGGRVLYDIGTGPIASSPGWMHYRNQNEMFCHNLAI